MAEAAITCILIPRFQLKVTVGGRAELLGSPVAIAPEPGSRLLGEVSVAAEPFGIHPGMRLGEALARCPRLALVPPDPAGVEDRWERLLVALEAIGAAVEPLRPGLVCFDAGGLLRLHRGGLQAVLEAARGAIEVPARFGVAPTRFAAIAAATRARVRRPAVVRGGTREARAYLATASVALLRSNPELAGLVEPLERLGVATLGELAQLPSGAVVDRFGSLGQRARQLATGHDRPLWVRRPGELIEESLDLPEAAGGLQLERALGLLIDRLLSCRERRGRTLRSAMLAAVLVEQGGTWRRQVSFREALSDPVRMRLALVPALAQLPAPARRLRLVAQSLGPPVAEQGALLGDPARVRRRRLLEAVRQVRATAGPDAALRVLAIDPDSRLPERRSVLAPFE